ncbi:MAG: hypothetical protein ACK2TV_06915 [Anaerolineales bacterium]
MHQRLDEKMPMINYEMKFSVSGIARVLEVDKDVVKLWASIFKEYLKSPANPPKGIPRQFDADDLRVLSYISMYWEDDPDIESIKRGLNSNHHYEEIYNHFISSKTPLFIDPPVELNEDWRHGSLIGVGGLTEVEATLSLADSYKLAGDRLIEAALSNDEANELISPIIYVYRHSTELYFKAIIGPRKGHDLGKLLEEFKSLLEEEFPELNTDLPSEFEDTIRVFNDFDQSGTAFRYSGDSFREAWVDLIQVKSRMGWMAESFQIIWTRLREKRRLQ